MIYDQHVSTEDRMELRDYNTKVWGLIPDATAADKRFHERQVAEDWEDDIDAEISARDISRTIAHYNASL